jgi:squalene-hopene/tetraprenyl-beta-curcumene cyclase
MFSDHSTNQRSSWEITLQQLILSGLALFVAAGFSAAADPGPNKPDEPIAKTVSLEKGAAFLDMASLSWTQKRQCGSCHTNVPYLIARPALKQKTSEEEKLVRKFFEDRAARWDRRQKGDQPRWDTEVVVTGVTLAMHDAATTGKLHPLTAKALDRMWTLQKPHGAWNWLKCKWPPLEHDDYYGAVFAAVGVSIAPGDYAKSDRPKVGLEKLRTYLKKTPAPSLHHKAWLLWASQKLDDLMTKDERERTIKGLLDLQKSDGGWSLPSLGDWKGKDGRENDLSAPSDGYATGLVVYILRQAGLPASHDALKKGAGWLRNNQRVSGRWFTRSLNSDGPHYITHTGTAFALLALKACE